MFLLRSVYIPSMVCLRMVYVPTTLYVLSLFRPQSICVPTEWTKAKAEHRYKINGTLQGTRLITKHNWKITNRRWSWNITKTETEYRRNKCGGIWEHKVQIQNINVWDLWGVNVSEEMGPGRRVRKIEGGQVGWEGEKGVNAPWDGQCVRPEWDHFKFSWVLNFSVLSLMAVGGCRGSSGFSFGEAKDHSWLWN